MQTALSLLVTTQSAPPTPVRPSPQRRPNAPLLRTSHPPWTEKQGTRLLKSELGSFSSQRHPQPRDGQSLPLRHTRAYDLVPRALLPRNRSVPLVLPPRSHVQPNSRLSLARSLLLPRLPGFNRHHTLLVPLLLPLTYLSHPPTTARSLHLLCNLFPPLRPSSHPRLFRRS